MKQLRVSDRGFTLLEVLVSLAVLSIGIVLVIKLFSAGLGSAKNSGDYTRAVVYARQKMTEALQTKTLNEGSIKGVTAGGFLWTVEVSPMEMPEGDTGIKVFKVVTRIRNPQGKKVLTLETLKTVL